MTMIFNRLTREQIAELRSKILDKHSNLDMTITRTLLMLGFRPHLVGTMYLRIAIKRRFTMGDNTKVSFGNDIYAYVANECDTTPRRVERDIRTAIHGAFNSGSLSQLNFLMGYDLISSMYPPTNSEVITGIASWLRLELAELGIVNNAV